MWEVSRKGTGAVGETPGRGRRHRQRLARILRRRAADVNGLLTLVSLIVHLSRPGTKSQVPDCQSRQKTLGVVLPHTTIW